MHVRVPCGMESSLVGAEVTQPSLSLCDELGGLDAGRLQQPSHLFLLFPFAPCHDKTPVL